MSYDPSPASLKLVADLILDLYAVAATSARAAAKQGRRMVPRSQRNRTLRPGAGTPLWNELVKQAQPFLRQRGTKAQLARVLGVPRQRLQDCLKTRSACLDAERTLLLLCWVVAQRQGRDLTA